MKLEYVASGTSYMRLSNPSIQNDPRVIALVNNIFYEFFNDQPGHTFSLLYNAFKEKDFGNKLSVFKESIHNLHADSGGLQMVTLAHNLPKGQNMDTLRENVYANQAASADVGMCFDEIPVITTGWSDKNDTSNRYFDRANRHTYAKQTGENLKRQIEVFKTTDSKCKPFMICQGGDLETYVEWTKTILDTVPKENHKRIAGVAMGGAALGTGALEDIQKAFFASQVPVRDATGKLHLHILGVGSIRRMIPYLIFLQNGLYGDVQVSYDSTTHTRAVETGLYYMRGKIEKNGFHVDGPGKTLKYSRARGAEDVLHGTPREAYPDLKYDVMIADINRFYNMDLTPEEFHETLNTPSIAYFDKHGSLLPWFLGRTTMCCASIKNFMDEVEVLINSKEKLLKMASEKYPGLSAEQLFDVKDIESFNRWLGKWTPMYQAEKKSNRISHIAPSERDTLEELFG